MNKEFKPFQQILVKQGVWRAAYFSHFAKDGSVITTGGFAYNIKLVLPYEGNEGLLGTDNSLKPKRWRAERGKVYYFVGDELRVTSSSEDFDTIDDNRYQIGNYFKSYKEAEVVAEKFKELLKDDSSKV